jgi:hypothetical protein
MLLRGSRHFARNEGQIHEVGLDSTRLLAWAALRGATLESVGKGFSLENPTPRKWLEFFKSSLDREGT